MAVERNPFDKMEDTAEPKIEIEQTDFSGSETSIEVDPISGEVTVEFESSEMEDEDSNGMEDEEDFYRNLVDDLDDQLLNEISSMVFDHFEADKQSRAEWESMFERGFDLLGLKLEETSEPFEGACTAVHPVLIESAVKFQSKATQELFPPAGPIKTQILGEFSVERENQAKRIKEFMNYQITELMPEYFDEFERMLFHLPLIGSAFKKIYFDENLNRPVSEFVPIDQFYVSYNATDLRRADRYTHVIYYSPVEMIRAVSSGRFRDVNLTDAPMPKQTTIGQKIDSIMGMSPSLSMDPQYTVLEHHCYLELPKKFIPKGHNEMVPLPYIITVEDESRKVLSIRRNYDKDDKRKEKKIYFTHYKFVPGFGFYGLGLIHFLGNMTLTATAAMRSLVDAGQFANLAGGFKAKGVRIVGDNNPIAPGEWKEVEAVGNDLTKMIIPLPYKEPSQTLFQMLQFISAAAQKFADTTEQVISDAGNYGPVGTTMALLEASSKFFSAIHKRLHKAQKEEFKLLARINYEYLPEESGLDVPDGTLVIFRSDFDGKIDVVPVSDPNIPSNAHRMMMAQMAMNLAQSSPPGMFDMEVLNRTILQAANIPNLDKIMPRKVEPVPLDPVSDIAAAVKGLPIRAFVGQNHDAHVQAKMMYLQDPMNGASPIMQRVAPILQANIQEHMVMKYQEQVNGVARQMMQAAQQTGQINANDPQVIEMVMAQAAQQVMQANAAMAQMQQTNTPEAQMVQLEAQRLQIEQGKVQAQLAKESVDAAMRNRELDLKETAMRIDMMKEGIKTSTAINEKEKDRSNKKAIVALQAIMDLAKTQQGIEKDKALKAADILSQILQQDKSQAKMQ
jgi:hypothetical protein